MVTRLEADRRLEGDAAHDREGDALEQCLERSAVLGRQGRDEPAVRFGEEAFDEAEFAVEGDRVQPWQGLQDAGPLEALAGRIDVLFLGLGEQIGYAPREMVAMLDGMGIRVEAMPSPTAARTYNVTLSEGRRVACALLPL